MVADADTTADARWLTYGELAAVRGIARLSAERLARRMRWRRQSGNDGFARVLVPVAFLGLAGDRSKDGPHDAQGDEQGESPHAVETALAMLGERLAREDARADRAEATAAELRVQLEHAQREVADLRTQLERTQGYVEQAQREAQEAQEAADELRQAEATRKGRGLPARLLAALRRQ